MSHLFVLSIGPVQEFIAAARRTRDLWYGSHLLSALSKAAAAQLAELGGKLIFPSSDQAECIANVILAELQEGLDPAHTAAEVKKAVQEYWGNVAKEVFKKFDRIIRPEIWNDQVDDVIEIYSAWVKQTDNYAEDRRKLMRIFAGRKSLRNFLPAQGLQGVPKSSLDGLRESVLKQLEKEKWPEHFRARLRIRDGEQLDVVGMVKRSAGMKKTFPSISRIAADPWIRGNANKPPFTRFLKACEELNKREILHSVGNDHPHFNNFPFEGSAVYKSRHQEFIEESEITLKDLEEIREALTGLKEPNSYLAVLVADGDNMGKGIAALGSTDKHRMFSEALDGFAQSARTIVERFHGVLIYAGGDDVIAFLPTDQCLACARELHDSFHEKLKAYGSLSLSAGIAIGHFMENLEDLLNYGRAAEKAAKQIPNKDALAVHLHKRGGAPIKIGGKWADHLDGKIARLASLMNEGKIPMKLPYELRSMASLYNNWKERSNLFMQEAIQKDICRVIAKKTSSGLESVQKVMSEFIQEMNSNKLLSLAEEMLVAKQIAEAQRQAEVSQVALEEVGT